MRGVLGAPFQMHRFPQIKAIAAFHECTAQGKLKAEIIPTIPTGFQTSIMKCPGRSEGITFPQIDLESPHARSQTSIASYTSPSPSALIFPVSKETRLPSGSLNFQNSSPICQTISPLLGAGRFIHFSFSSSIAIIVSSY
jgi:hypothetical protein